jgi:hypothetical protein
MTKRISRTKKSKESRPKSLKKRSQNRHSAEVTSPVNGAGRSLVSDLAVVRPAALNAEIVNTERDVRSAEIDERIIDGVQNATNLHDQTIFVQALARLRRLQNGTHLAADRVLVTEQLNGTQYRHLSGRPWTLQIVYLDGDPIAEDQFLRLLNSLM